MVMVTVLVEVGGDGCELAVLFIPPPPQATSAISSRSMSASMTAERRRFRPAVQTRPKGASVANQKAKSGRARRGELGSETRATLAEAVMVNVAVAPLAPGAGRAGASRPGAGAGPGGASFGLQP